MLEDGVTGVELLLAIAGAVAATGVIVRGLVWLFVGFRKASKTLEALQNILNQELQPNHGSSLKDQVNLIASWIKRHEAEHLLLKPKEPPNDLPN